MARIGNRLAADPQPAKEDAASAIARGPREPGDDFVCLRYAVWYDSRDCALRTRYQTSPGCAGCDQGRFNLKRHAAGLIGRADRRWRAAFGG